MTTLRWTLRATTVAAVFGAGLGWFFFWDRSGWDTVWVLLAAVALGVLVPLLLVRIRPAAPPPPPVPPPAPANRAPSRPTADWWAQPGPARSAVAASTVDHGAAAEPGTVRISTIEPAPPARRDPVHLVLPVDGDAHPGPWPTPTDPVRAATPGRPGAADLAAYRDAARIVQCPRCGSFRVEPTRIGSGIGFRCRTDDHEWTWRPGTAWPVTVVASRRRTDRRPDR